MRLKRAPVVLPLLLVLLLWGAGTAGALRWPGGGSIRGFGPLRPPALPSSGSGHRLSSLQSGSWPWGLIGTGRGSGWRRQLPFGAAERQRQQQGGLGGSGVLGAAASADGEGEIADGDGEEGQSGDGADAAGKVWARAGIHGW